MILHTNKYPKTFPNMRMYAICVQYCKLYTHGSGCRTDLCTFRFNRAYDRAITMTLESYLNTLNIREESYLYTV